MSKNSKKKWTPTPEQLEKYKKQVEETKEPVKAVVETKKEEVKAAVEDTVKVVEEKKEEQIDNSIPSIKRPRVLQGATYKIKTGNINSDDPSIYCTLNHMDNSLREIFLFFVSPSTMSFKSSTDFSAIS